MSEGERQGKKKRERRKPVGTGWVESLTESALILQVIVHVKLSQTASYFPWCCLHRLARLIHGDETNGNATF